MKVTRLEQGKKNKRRLNVFVENEFVFACFAEIASEFGIQKGAPITPEIIETAKLADDRQSAREYAFRYAARGLKSEKQFRDKMLERKFLPESIDGAIEALKQYGYINDEEYARMYAEELFGKYGTWVVKRKLKERGISDRITSLVTEDVDTHDTLVHFLQGAMRKYAADEPARRRERVTRYLASRGFDFDDIKDAINAFENEEQGVTY